MKTELNWVLNESLRFPVNAEGWDSFPGLPPAISLSLPGRRDIFTQMLNPRSPTKTVQLMATLIRTKPEVFEIASAAITPEGFRQLYHRGTYVLDCLAAPRFHADQTLRMICEHPELFDDAPAEWLGTSTPLDDVAADTLYAIRQTGRETARAIWAILSVAQCIPLTQAEVLHCRWWSPRWLTALATHLGNP